MRQLKSILLNWRYYVMTLLLAVGLLSMLAVFGRGYEDRPILVWFGIRLGFLFVAFVNFYTLRRLRIRWESRDEIPEFTNQ